MTLSHLLPVPESRTHNAVNIVIVGVQIHQRRREKFRYTSNKVSGLLVPAPHGDFECLSYFLKVSEHQFLWKFLLYV